jgi:hypothetical protein
MVLDSIERHILGHAVYRNALIPIGALTANGPIPFSSDVYIQLRVLQGLITSGTKF